MNASEGLAARHRLPHSIHGAKEHLSGELTCMVASEGALPAFSPIARSSVTADFYRFPVAE